MFDDPVFKIIIHSYLEVLPKRMLTVDETEIACNAIFAAYNKHRNPNKYIFNNEGTNKNVR